MQRVRSGLFSCISAALQNIHCKFESTVYSPQKLKLSAPCLVSPLQFSSDIKKLYFGDFALETASTKSPWNLIIENQMQVFFHDLMAPAQIKPNNFIEAARMIVIRRRKMKKHKLKKLRKKMKFEWAKVRQRREMRKEKVFQNNLISQVKKADIFSAEKYIISKLKEANKSPLPRYWKDRRLPQFVIKDILNIKNK